MYYEDFPVGFQFETATRQLSLADMVDLPSFGIRSRFTSMRWRQKRRQRLSNADCGLSIND